MTDHSDDPVAKLVGDLARARVAWTSPTIRSWYDASALSLNLHTAMTVEGARVGDAEFGGGFRDGVGIGGPENPLAWANRRLDLPDGGWALAGIRFRGRDIAWPFVDVVATTAPPTGQGLALVAEAVDPAYREFAPRCLRVDAPDAPGLAAELRRDPRFGAGCSVDQHVVAGPVRRLRTRPRAAAYPRVRLRPGDPATLAARVHDVYAELAAVEPELPAWAQPEDAESLGSCADEGLLFEVLVDDEPAGVVAALRHDDHAMSGFAVQELCLDAGHRGRHLAAAAMQRLADALPARAGDVLWGTIHPDNAPSLRNARSVGRDLVGGYVWVTPGGPPG